MRLAVLLALFTLFCPLLSEAADAEFPWISGNTFLRICARPVQRPGGPTEDDLNNAIACDAYVMGFTEGVDAANYQQTAGPYCIPKDVSAGQMVRIVYKYIEDHPARAHYRTSVLAFVAFSDAFPCQKNK